MKKITTALLLFHVIIITHAQNFDWAISFGGANSDYPNSITTDGIGNIYVGGYFEGTVDFDPGNGLYNMTSSGDKDAYIVKLDTSGNFIWAQTFGSIGTDVSTTIEIDENGDILLAGLFEDSVDFDPGINTFILSTTQFYSGFIIKLSPGGNLIWAKKVEGGFDGYQVCKVIASDIFGNTFLSIEFTDSVDANPGIDTLMLYSSGMSDVYILKLDLNGDFLWAKQLMGDWEDFITSIDTDANGNVYAAGRFHGPTDFDPGTNSFIQTTSTPGYFDAYILKLDSNGDFIWMRQLNTSLFPNDPVSITIGINGSLYINGHFKGTVDFDPGVGNYNLTATSFSTGDSFIEKLTADGNFIWAIRLGGSSSCTSYSLSLDAYDNIYTTGFFTQTADFDPGLGTFSLTTNNAPDIFLSKLDSNANFKMALQTGITSSSELGYCISVDQTGSIYTSGIFYITSDFDPGSNTYNLTSNGNQDVFIQKLRQNITHISEIKPTQTLFIYPNPSYGQITIDTQNESKKYLKIYNISGMEVYSSEMVKAVTLNLSFLAKGMYTVFVTDDSNIFFGKFIHE